MARMRSVAAYPWAALDRVFPAVEASLRSARPTLERAGNLEGLAGALAELTGIAVSLVFRSISARPIPPHFARIGFDLADGSAAFMVALEPALGSALLAALLRRPAPLLLGDSQFDPVLLGALAALFTEAARSSGALVPLRPASGELPPGSAIVHVTVLVGGKPYDAALGIRATLPRTRFEARASLGALGDVELALPLVVGTGALERKALSELMLGSGFMPGEPLWIDRSGRGRGVLVAATSEQGVPVSLGPEGMILEQPATAKSPDRAETPDARGASKIRTDAEFESVQAAHGCRAREARLERALVALAVETNSMESSERREPDTLAEVVLDAPLVVRVELGQVSMPARRWAALKPGDVVETGVRLAEPVVLRAGGRVIARGELVNVEGELGVRVLELPLGEER